MGSGNGSGVPPHSQGAEEPTPEEQQRMLLDMMTRDIYTFLDDQEDVPAQAKLNAAKAAVEQFVQLPPFMQMRKSTEDGKKIWGVQITSPKGKTRFQALKRFEDASKPDEVLATAAVLALATSPYARAALVAHGWQIDFVQITVKPKSAIYMPGS